MAVGQVVQIVITGNSDQAIASIEKLATATEASAKKSAKSFDDFGKAATLGLVAAGAAIAAFGVKQAMEQETATAKLKTAINNTGAAYADYTKKIEAASKAGINLGFDDAAVVNSLARLTAASHSAGTALKDMSLAEDIARARHIDLQAATDLLAKVETGHVALLGRLGVNTKDATGATISQEEAIKRLTAMYGGQAQAYTQTFAGKIEVLKAQMGELAEKVGFVLIPIIEKMASGLSDAVDFFEKNKAAAIALAVIVGGPLVASMVTWIATMVAAKATAFGSFLVDMGLEVGILIEKLAALEAAEVAAQLAWLAAPIAIGAAIVAIGSWIDHAVGMEGEYGKIKDAQQKGTEQGKKWADSVVEQAKVLGATQDAVNLLKLRLVDLKGTLAAQIDAFDQGKLSAEGAAKANSFYETASKKLRTELVATKDQVDKYNESVKVVTATVVASANVLGVILPSNLGKDKDAIKELSKGIEDAVPVFGAFATQTLVDLHETGQGLTDLAKKVTDFSKTVGDAIDSATNPFSHFASATEVSEADLEKFWVDSMNNARDWAAELQDLVKQGLDQGIVQQIAAAGPAAKPALDAFVEMVQKWGGVDAVNAFNAAGKAARDALVKQMAQMQLDVAIELARLQQDMIDHPVEVYFKANQASIAAAIAPLLGGTADIPVPFGQTGGTDTPGYVPSPHYTSDGTYIGTFDKGGVIPGPMGTPYLATVHGGETVIPAGGGSGDTYHFYGMDPEESVKAMIRTKRTAAWLAA